MASKTNKKSAARGRSTAKRASTKTKKSKAAKPKVAKAPKRTKNAPKKATKNAPKKAAKNAPKKATKNAPKKAAQTASKNQAKSAPGKAAAPKRGKSAAELAKSARDISVSEFFAKNRHLLGFDNPSKALLTTVKEGVDNSLDACEEAGILPDFLLVFEAMPPEPPVRVAA